jgi:predicted nucleotidyltransferase
MSVSLTSILFSDYRRRVLGLLLLHPEQRYHLREIARLTGTVPGTLTRELAKLERAGLLLKEGVGRQLFYTANRDCPIFEELAGILRKTSGVVDVLADALLPLAGRIEIAFVFGSMAAGRAAVASDVDLMVIGEVDFTEVNAALYPAQQALGREINPKVYRPGEWRELVRRQGAFVKDVLAKPKLMVMGVMDDLEKS